MSILEWKEFIKFYDVYDEIISKYYKDIKFIMMIDGVINGMVNLLDDLYFIFMLKKEFLEFNDIIFVSFEGIGVEI